MDPSQTSYPPMKDLTAENITENVNLINSGCDSPRVKFLVETLVRHLHDYCRETQLSMQEWTDAVQFLTNVGQKCSDTRQEFVLLSDVLGVSMLVDAIDHPKPTGASEGTVLGPFHTEDAHNVPNGEHISADADGIPLLVYCTLKDTNGNPIADAKVDVWETDSHGLYDVQYKDRKEPSGRAVLRTNEKGVIWFEGIVPVPYPVPVDGPVGGLLRALKRHPYRPAHFHFMFEKEGYDHFITALTLRGDPYESHDPVFGVKDSLLADLKKVDDPAMAKECGVELGMKLLYRDFVMTSDEEAAELRRQNAKHFMDTHGEGLRFVKGRPVPSMYST